MAGLIMGSGVASVFLLQRMNSDAAQARFDAEATGLSDAIVDTLQEHIALVEGGVGIFNASADVNREEWMRYVEVLHLRNRFPGTPALVFARFIPEENVPAFEAGVAADPLREQTMTPAYAIWPPATVGDRVPFDFIAPADGLSKAFGYDLLSNDAARIAVERTRDEGGAILSRGSGPITANVPGQVVIIVQAVYAHGEPLDTVAERRHAFVGVVGAVVRLDPTVHALLVGVDDAVDIEVRLMGPSQRGNSSIFDRHPSNGSAAGSMPLTATMDHRLGGEIVQVTVGRAAPSLSFLETYAWIGAIVIYALLGLAVGTAAFQWQTREVRAQRLAERATQEVREGAGRLDEAQEIAQMGSWDLDVASQQVTWSRGLCRLLGVDAETYAPVPESLFGFVHPEDRDRLKAKLETAIGSATAVSEDVRIVRAEGEVRQCHVQLRPSAGASGKVERLTGTLQDVSRQRSAQAAIEEAYERRRQLDKLAVAQEERARLFNVMAHELNNPLSPIQLQVHLMREMAASSQSPQQAKALEIVDRSVARLARLVADIRDLGRLDTNSLKLRPKEFDLAAVVKDVVDLQRPVAQNVGVRLELAADAPAPVHADSDRIAQIVTNLLSNAIKYSPQDSTVTVRLSRDPTGFQVAVADQGPGLDPKQIQRLFAPFSQVQEAGTQKPGTGLGLYVSRGLAEAHGGKLSCESDGPGAGTTFTLHLPLKPSGPGADANPGLGPTSTTAPTA